MVKFIIKGGPQGHYYFPKELREALGEEVEVVPNAFAAALYNKDTNPENVIKSLEIILEDLRLRLLAGAANEQAKKP